MKQRCRSLATIATVLSSAVVSLVPQTSFAARITLKTPERTSFSRGVGHVWPDSAKELVGTAYGPSTSRVWFTTNSGIVTEVYYPRIDRPQVADLQVLFSNLGEGKPTFLEEKRDFTLTHKTGANTPRAVIRGSYEKNGISIRFTKEVIVDPASPVLRVRYTFDSIPAEARVHILQKPTADGDGARDVARVAETDKGPVLVAWDDEARSPNYQVFAVNSPTESLSVGSVGADDGWQQLNRFGRIAYESDSVGPSNIALTATVKARRELDILVGFGGSVDDAYDALSRSRESTFDTVRLAFDAGWNGYYSSLEASAPWLAKLPAEIKKDTLWSASVVKVHEDKANPGAIVASLSVPDLPAGQGAGDGKGTGGYRLVWARDLFKSAAGLMRLGDLKTVTDTLRFMSRQEMPDGRIAQNTYVDGKPYWVAQQMDQEAYPLILAALLKEKGVQIDSGMQAFLDRRAAIVANSNGYTAQERWEEEGGFSPNTLAVMAAAMQLSGRPDKAAKFLSVALEKSVVRSGPLSSRPYFVRIAQRGLPDAGDWLQINNGGPWIEEAKQIDGGFLEWARWFPNPRASFASLGDELSQVLENSASVYANPNNGVAFTVRGLPLYRRYNLDAYGLKQQGGPWPILTAESFLPRLALDSRVGIDAFRTVRSLWTPSRMCPEQLSVENETLKAMPYAATPLVWCHAEMIELAYRGAAR